MGDNGGSMPAFVFLTGMPDAAQMRHRYRQYARNVVEGGFPVVPLLELAARHDELNADHLAHRDDEHVAAYATLDLAQTRTLVGIATSAMVLCGYSVDDIGDEGLKDGYPVPSFLMARMATPIPFNDGDTAVANRLADSLQDEERGYLVCTLAACLHTMGFTPDGMRNLLYPDPEDSR